MTNTANALLPFQTLLDLTGISWLIHAASGIAVKMEWNLLNSCAGLIMLLGATATGTFLYRQFFLTIPEELVEAAKMDGAGPLRFLWDVLIPCRAPISRRWPPSCSSMPGTSTSGPCWW